MFIRDLVFALAAGLVLTAALAIPWGVRRFGAAAYIWPFLVLFLSAWAGGLWIAPIGPPFMGGYFLPFFITAFLIALVLGASGEAPPGIRLRRATGPEPEQNAASAAAVSITLFLWLVVLCLLAAIVAFYLVR